MYWAFGKIAKTSKLGVLTYNRLRVFDIAYVGSRRV